MKQNMKEPAVTDMNAEKPQPQYRLICFHNPATATGRKGRQRSASAGKKRETNTLPGPEWPAPGAHGLQNASGNPDPLDPGQMDGCTVTGMSGTAERPAESGQAGAVPAGTAGGPGGGTGPGLVIPGDIGLPDGYEGSGPVGPSPAGRNPGAGLAGAASRSLSAAAQDSVPDGAEGTHLPVDPEGREGTPREETAGADTTQNGHPAAGETGGRSL